MKHVFVLVLHMLYVGEVAFLELEKGFGIIDDVGIYVILGCLV